MKLKRGFEREGKQKAVPAGLFLCGSQHTRTGLPGPFQESPRAAPRPAPDPGCPEVADAAGRAGTEPGRPWAPGPALFAAQSSGAPGGGRLRPGGP